MYEQCLIMFGADRKPEIGMLVIMSGLDRSCDGQGRGHGRVDAGTVDVMMGWDRSCVTLPAVRAAAAAPRLRWG